MEIAAGVVIVEIATRDCDWLQKLLRNVSFRSSATAGLKQQADEKAQQITENHPKLKKYAKQK